MEFDIRINQAEEITLLRFADDGGGYHASGILRRADGSVEVIDIESERSEHNLQICSEEDAQNLIKALHKAIELSWFKE